MRVLKSSSEAEMIAEFLRQEYASFDRYGEKITRALADEVLDATIITSPNLGNAEENVARLRKLLSRTVGQVCGSWLHHSMGSP